MSDGREPAIARAWRPLVWLLVVWGAATAANLTKAVHIDDTFYLEQAAWIRRHPLRPMSGEVFWRDHPRPAREENAPPLVPYFFAVSGWLSGDSDGTAGEVTRHLAYSLFTLLGTVIFYYLARGVSEQRALLLTALFVLGPHFVPGQNLMADVPATVFWLGALAAHWSRRSRPVLGGLSAVAALLAKYSSLGLGAVFLIDAAVRRRRAALVSALVMAGGLAAWCGFNYLEYGGIHIFDRAASQPGRPPWFLTVLAWLICLGAVSPFSLLALPLLGRSGPGRLAVGAVALGAAASVVAGPTSGGTRWPDALLRALFLGNGALVIAGLVAGILTWRRLHPEDDRWWLLALAALGSAAAVLVMAPFLAVRHVMVFAALFLLAVSRVASTGNRPGLSAVTLSATLALSAILTVADYTYASVYRDAARSVAGMGRLSVYFTGHWGWQWYAARAGMTPYDPGRTELREGDLLVVPRHIAAQRIDDRDRARLILVEERSLTARWAFGVRTMAPQAGEEANGYYASNHLVLPWTLRTGPVERLAVFRCCR